MTDAPTPRNPPATCATCSLRDLCLPMGLDPADLARTGCLGGTRQSVPRGQPLFRVGDPFAAVLAVNTGFFKTRQTGPLGDERVTGFHMAGDLLGLEGLGTERHTVDAIALEDSQVCVVPYPQWIRLLRELPVLQLHFHRLMGQEIARGIATRTADHLRAETRVAAFILGLASRLRLRGYSSSELVLRMSRAEIGSYLGVTLETVSRAMSTFQARQWLEVRQRHVRIVDHDALARLVAAEATC